MEMIKRESARITIPDGSLATAGMDLPIVAPAQLNHLVLPSSGLPLRAANKTRFRVRLRLHMPSSLRRSVDRRLRLVCM